MDSHRKHVGGRNDQGDGWRPSSLRAPSARVVYQIRPDLCEGQDKRQRSGRRLRLSFRRSPARRFSRPRLSCRTWCGSADVPASVRVAIFDSGWPGKRDRSGRRNQGFRPRNFLCGRPMARSTSWDQHRSGGASRIRSATASSRISMRSLAALAELLLAEAPEKI